ncbi:MAG: rRNA maturation RNase YbeY [candidate division Zixibacteria bacterium]|nr:rRNA maturation RNase YbeY [candidate division Zixibacteria bacterium]
MATTPARLTLSPVASTLRRVVQMHDLNKRFRRRNRPTDVLAFPFDNGDGHSGMMGEIYCNYDHARRWRVEHGGTIADEILRLAVHGCLHLLGYDHHTAADRRRMTRAENRYLVREGLIGARTLPHPARPSRRHADG